MEGFHAPKKNFGPYPIGCFGPVTTCPRLKSISLLWHRWSNSRATMQRLKSNDMQSQQHHLSFLLLFQHLVQVSYLCDLLKQGITYVAMLHRSVNGYVEKWHANTTAEHKNKKDSAKIHLCQTWWLRESRGCWWWIITTNFLSFKQQILEKIHSTTEERK